MSGSRQQSGNRAEELAADYLRKKGYAILHRNLRLGRLGELDIVADDKGLLVFVEVKARVAGGIGGLEHINATKMKKLADLASAYLQKYGGRQRGVRFDAVEVVFSSAGSSDAELRHIPDAFRLN